MSCNNNQYIHDIHHHERLDQRKHGNKKHVKNHKNYKIETNSSINNLDDIDGEILHDIYKRYDVAVEEEEEEEKVSDYTKKESNVDNVGNLNGTKMNNVTNKTFDDDNNIMHIMNIDDIDKNNDQHIYYDEHIMIKRKAHDILF